VIVPLLLNVAIKLLPADVREESILKANRNQNKFKWVITLLILFVIALLVGMFFLIRSLISH
jgi:accessory gene regulator protein AgrB